MKTLSLACISGSCFLGVLLFFYWRSNFINPVYQVYAESSMMSTVTPEPEFTPRPVAEVSTTSNVVLSSKKSETTNTSFFGTMSSRFLVPAPVVSVDYETLKAKIGSKRLVKKIIAHHDLMASLVTAPVSNTGSAPTPVAENKVHEAPKAAEVHVEAAPKHEAEEAKTAIAHNADATPDASEAATTTTASTVRRSLTVVEETKTEKKNLYIPSYMATRQTETGNVNYSYVLLYEKAEKLRTYAEQHGYDTQYAFMIDMGMKSGKKRFFVVDLENMTIVKRGLVAHGRGDERFTFDKKYSNKMGSNCTSLGIYKVGRYYNGIFGPAYRLIGLQQSNSNAMARAIVLHGMNCIPDDESDFPVCQSEGCPSLSPKFLQELKTVIEGRTKPMLLWMFDTRADDDGF